ncbi:hypothetical protein COOONC_08397, partial [Cooperia oncophora]
MDSRSRQCEDGSLITLTKRYRNRCIHAEFSRPLVTNSSDLSACQTWNFITTPTKIGDGSYYVNSSNSNSVQLCNIMEDCDVLKIMNATLSSRPLSDPAETRRPKEPKVVAVLISAAPNSTQQPSTAASPALLPWNAERTQRRKRQTGYTPTNNIYGYDYNSSPSSSSDAARLVLNPNYAYLNDALSEGYAKNYVQAEMAYSQGGQVGGQVGGYQAYDAVPAQSAILSNDQQNALNYQQIRQSNPGSYNPPLYSGNYYGGAQSG